MTEPDALAVLTQRMDAIEARNEALAAENRDLRVRLADRPDPPEPADAATATDPGAPVGRRSLLRGGLAAGAAAAAGVVLLDGSPAAAANGDAFRMASYNTSTAPTAWDMGPSALSIFGRMLATSEANDGIGSFVNDGEGAGLVGANRATGPRSGVGLLGTSVDNSGVKGRSTNGFGVLGEAPNGTGVVGSAYNGVSGIATNVAGHGVVGGNTLANGTGSGVRALATSGTGLDATSVTGTAVKATSTNGTALRLDARVPVDIIPRQGPPVTGARKAGQLWMEGDTIDGTLWLCVSSGTPGLWRKVGGLETSGSLHVLPAPARVYDSRPGTTPTSIGPKTKFAAGQTRTFDLKANSSGVPAGASAALVTLLLVNASTAPGNMTIWANGVAKPTANTLVWGGTAGRFTATATTALDTLARVQVNASRPTDLVLDVVGYYR